MVYVCSVALTSIDVVCDELHNCEGSKRHNLLAVELSRRLQTVVQLVAKPPAPAMGSFLPFFGRVGHVTPLDGWRRS